MSVRLEVLWSPVHYDKFITWGTEINLYETLPRKDINKPNCIDLSETTTANLVATNSHHHYVKCVDICPKQESDVLLAIGQANGKVTLTTFGPTVFDSLGLTGQELSPKHARQCNSVTWNPLDSNLIAVALDKHRTEHSVMLWDVLKGPTRQIQHGGGPPIEIGRPVAELGLSDTAHSLAWLRSQPRSLVIGMNNKHVKMVDLRDPSKAVNSAPTKAVYGINVSPCNDHQLASFVDNQIAIWDTRNFEKPVLTLPQPKPVLKVLWCPTRQNLLGSLQREATSIHLHDIQQSVDDSDLSVLERNIQPKADTLLTSFSWHPHNENRLLTIAINGAMVDYSVYERMTLNWSPSSHIVWTYGRRTLNMISQKDSVYKDLKDISTTIKKRAISGYGLKNELWRNGDLAENNSLKKLWHWLHLSNTLVEDNILPMNGTHHPGIRSVLGLDVNTNTITSKSEMVCLPWADIPGSAATNKAYRSEDRDKCLRLCDWRFEKDPSALAVFLERLQLEGEYSRAAAISVFNLRLRSAIEILNNGAQYEMSMSRNGQSISNNQSHFNIVAMALSGYSEDKNSMWRELCMSSRPMLSNPYLRATFAFLTSDSESYETVLAENEMAVEDKVAFACTFLSNKRLAEYLTELNNTMIEQGNLAGILLTGGGSVAIPLLQRYLDSTGDVQSVSLIACRSFPTDLIDNDPTVCEWIASYRSLLDSWRLWNQRAHFDIYINNRNQNNKPAQQIYVACNFCAKSISAYSIQGFARNRGPFSRLGTSSNRLKISSCPNCRKPQPRCAICLVNMGTASCYSGQRSQSPTAQGGANTGQTNTGQTMKLSEFTSWFTWCQTCRHGGHASHMQQWFRDHLECPVTACTCRCLTIDVANKIPSVSSVTT